MTQKSNPSLQYEFSCELRSGLHARPASHLAEVANRFASDCSLTNLRNGLVANAKSVLGILAADVRYQDRCVLFVSGSDEDRAHLALRQYLEKVLEQHDVPLAEMPATGRTAVVPKVLQASNVACITGIPVSRGLARGRVVRVQRMAFPSGLQFSAPTDIKDELKRIEVAVEAVRERIAQRLKYAITPVGTAVMQADLAMAKDVLLAEKLKEQILNGKSAAQAIVETGEFFIDLLGHSETEYIRQRASDVEEICLQLLEEVGGTTAEPAVELEEPSVVVAEMLAPQQLLRMDRRWLKALVLEHSGTTSHAAILARSLGIPALAGVRNARLALTPGTEVIVDAGRGFVVPQISSAAARFYEREEKTLSRRNEYWLHRANQPALTTDGETIEVAANTSTGEETIFAFESGADGIGLFRTEMIFLGRDDAPTEEEQCAIYSEAVRTAKGKPVIIRTFDIGGDKKVPYMNLEREENPFLGYRGARVYGEYAELLGTQLRAILRALNHGNVQIMAPMITSVEEIRQFKDAISAARSELIGRGIDCPANLKIGMMVEVPSVCFMIEELCSEVDFFSIGTNDLNQYFFAADRSNSRVSSQFSVRHPAFLRLLDQVVAQIHKHRKWVGMCGEMASDIQNLPLLLGLGLDEISVAASEVREFKRSISRWNSENCGEILNRALGCESMTEVNEMLAAEGIQPAGDALLSDELIVLGSSSQTKEEVMQEMVDALYIAGRTEDRHVLEEALWAREAMGSTAVGYGFAIPHCKTDAVSASSICVLRLNNAIAWDSRHEDAVDMVELLAVRDSDAANTHMQVFSSLARKLMNDEFRRHLLRTETARDTTQYLGRQLGLAPTSSEPVSR